MSLKVDYEITRGDTHGLADVSEFLGMLSRLQDHAAPELRTFFDPWSDITVARAPGRLDVMGGIADYSGSLVLELPTAEATLVALQKQDARQLSIVSLPPGSDATEGRVLSFYMPLADFEHDGKPIEYDDARQYFKRDQTRQWAAYVAGVFLVLMRQLGVRFDRGARILISSHVPEGKGVSSSAALEVATMSAVAAAFNIAIEPRELALLCQQVENLVVGAPCGVMDQMTSACGKADQLLALICQPAELLGTIQLPEDLTVWGLDSGMRHSIGGGDYGSVRAGTFMGYRIIAELAGLSVDRIGDRVVIQDPRWHGFLANLSPSEFEEQFAAKLPELLVGEEFLARYGGTVDPVTRVAPERTYPIRAPTSHAVYESFRVQRFAELLRRQHARLDHEEKITLGKLMYESHLSYSACGLGSTGTDLLVDLVRSTGTSQGLFGAKITGGGSGGTVAVLGNQNAAKVLNDVAQCYAVLTGHQPHIFSGSSPGSAAFGHLVVQRN